MILPSVLLSDSASRHLRFRSYRMRLITAIIQPTKLAAVRESLEKGAT